MPIIPEPPPTPSRVTDSALLAVNSLSVSYGAIPVVHSVTFEVRSGELLALVGANGAGKTTILRALSGLLPKTSGEVVYRQRNITGRRAHQIARAGLVHIPEGRQIFGPMTVAENLDMGAFARQDGDVEADRRFVFELFPVLADRRKQLAHSLSGGEQQMLAFGRALLARPTLIMMDEPSMGLAPQAADILYDAIQRINREGTAILLVEQSTERALDVAHRATVLERGHIVLEGPARSVRTNPLFVQAYLGPTAVEQMYPASVGPSR
jgi:branched-chain amino acid transport system ATP-binding protein